MPCTTYVSATSHHDCAAAISTHGCEPRAIAVQVRPSSICTRTSTSVIVSCRPANSMRLPASPSGPASSQRRSTSESASSWTSGGLTFRTSSGSCSAIGRRMPASTGVRHRRSNCPGAVSFSSRYAGRDSCACAAEATSSASNTAKSRLTAAAPRWRRLGTTALRAAARARSALGWRRGQEHRVLRAHRLVRVLARPLLLLAEPRRLHVGLDLLERGHAPGNDGVDEDQVPAVAGLDRPLPRARRELLDRHRERRPELLRQLARRSGRA